MTDPDYTAILHRLDRVEARVAAFDTALSMMRWLGPILVGIAGIIIGRFA